MNYDERCNDFDRRRPTGDPIRKTYWFTATWDNGNQSINDLLRSYLKDHGFPYLNTINGDVWFLFQDEWHMCEAEPDGEIVRFYMLDFMEC